MKKTAGKWNPKTGTMYFAAANIGSLELIKGIYNSVLIAVNELPPNDPSHIQDLLKIGCAVFIDSGVYSLAAETARVKNISHDEALRMPVHELRGYDELFERYTNIAEEFQDKAWGVVEIDLGGRDTKRKTRAKLEGMGLGPIPVYHPLNDGWDYLDELLENYDRICVGNIVNASRYVRKRIIATVWERKMRKNPSCWIHLLGLTLNDWLMAYPGINSCDSSSWLSAVRWNGYIEKTCQRSVGHMPKDFQYRLGDAATRNKGTQMAAVGMLMQKWNYDQWRRDADDLIPANGAMQKGVTAWEENRMVAK